MKMNEQDRKEFALIAKEILQGGRYAEMKNYYSHSDITVYTHCIKVAFAAYRFAVEHKIPCDKRALVRGALLHDYYLYDWCMKRRLRIALYKIVSRDISR